ncbi:MAG TPA: DUF4389 domain-containing protein [Gaiellaceae bacterium]|jgi:hypothetical protein
MAAHPIRVVVTDDRRRSRLTVFFRLFLAIPLAIWWALWSVAAIVAGIANWFATLVKGISPLPLHRFLAAYIRFSTHFFAYLYLAANPYPSFDGTSGYPVDCEIDPPERQNRWKVGFRLILALPALVLASVLVGGGIGGGANGAGNENGNSGGYGSAGVITTVAFLAWFACLARGRMPRGFRDLQAYLLRYGAQTWGYALMLTDRYPTADTEDPAPTETAPPHPVTVEVTDDEHRSRLTVFFRLLLAFPHFVWFLLWVAAITIIAIPVWLIVLIMGRMPEALHRFFAAFVRYSAHLTSFVYLIANPFPGFTGAPGYPVDAAIAPPERQNRWVIAFRAVLMIPALIVVGGVGTAVGVGSFFAWFASLATGRMPHGFRNLGAYYVRYAAQVNAYLFLLTDRYPDSGPSTARGTDEPQLELELAPTP